MFGLFPFKKWEKGRTVIELLIKSYEGIIIFIRAASLAKVITLDVKMSEIIENVKFKLQIQENIPKGIQFLSFKNKLLEDKTTLKDNVVQNYSIVDLKLTKKELYFFSIN